MRIFKNLGYPIGKSLSPIELNDIEDTFVVFVNRYEIQCIEEAARRCAEKEIAEMINDALYLEEKEAELYYDGLLNREATAKEIMQHTNQMLKDWKNKRKELKKKEKEKEKENEAGEKI